MQAYIKRLGMGLLIGVAAITPGLSGGVIAAAMGLYEPSVQAIVNIRKRPRESILFLIPLGLGVGAGVLLFSRIMEFLMEQASFGVLYAFFGLVAGSLPSVVKEAGQSGFRWRYLWGAGIALSLIVGFDLLTSRAPGIHSIPSPGVLQIMLYGAVLAFGTIIPGISSSFILIYIGAYQSLLSAIANFSMSYLLFFAIGFVAAALPLIKLVEVLFRKYRGISYSVVLGFLLGSVAVVFPGFRSGWHLAADLLLLVAGTALSYFVLGFHNKIQGNRLIKQPQKSSIQIE